METQRYQVLQQRKSDTDEWEDCEIDGYDPIVKAGYNTQVIYRLSPLKEQGERSGVKTAIDLLREIIYEDNKNPNKFLVTNSIALKAMQEYATQVAEAVRIQCSKVAYNEREPSLEILRINISDFIK